jgi:hypothetical protein
MAVNVGHFLMSRQVIPIMSAAGEHQHRVRLGPAGDHGRRYQLKGGLVDWPWPSITASEYSQNCIAPATLTPPCWCHEAQQLGDPGDKFLADAAKRPLGRWQAEEIRKPRCIWPVMRRRS